MKILFKKLFKRKIVRIKNGVRQKYFFGNYEIPNIIYTTRACGEIILSYGLKCSCLPLLFDTYVIWAGYAYHQYDFKISFSGSILPICIFRFPFINCWCETYAVKAICGFNFTWFNLSVYMSVCYRCENKFMILMYTYYTTVFW